jgi:hypothetical protein
MVRVAKFLPSLNPQHRWDEEPPNFLYFHESNPRRAEESPKLSPFPELRLRAGEVSQKNGSVSLLNHEINTK